MSLKKFEIDADPLGTARVTVDGVNVSEGLRALELVVAKDEITTLVLHTMGSGTIQGEGLVKVVDANLANIIASLDPEEIEQEAMSRTQWGTKNVVQLAVEIIKERLSGA